MGAMIAAVMTGFTSCGSDDDDANSGSSSGITGMYGGDNGTYSGTTFKMVYNFIDDNTVIDYSTVSNSSDDWRYGCEEMQNHSGWYYAPSSMRYLTYYIIDNKIFISDDTILTISGNTLLREGSSHVYKKW